MPDDKPVMKTSFLKPATPLWASTMRMAAPLFALLLTASVSCANPDRNHDRVGHDNRPPKVPASLQVPAGHELQFHLKGVGVQIYVWTQSATNPALFSWVFKAPHAVLLHHHEDLVGIHFAGPTWQANDGSKVVGMKVASSIVDPKAIPWLLLAARSTGAPAGLFSQVTHVQRIHTQGGVAPAAGCADRKSTRLNSSHG